VAGDDKLQEPPPILRTWGRLYLLVAGLLAADVILLYALVRWVA
jgi:hypothetical protein